MTRVKPLSPYMVNRNRNPGAVATNPLLKYTANITKKDPSEMTSPRLDSMDEQSVCNSIPISKFQSNHLSKKKQMVVNTDANL